MFDICYRGIRKFVECLISVKTRCLIFGRCSFSTRINSAHNPRNLVDEECVETVSEGYAISWVGKQSRRSSPKQSIRHIEQFLHISTRLVYHRAVVFGLRRNKMPSVVISTRREYISVNDQFTLSPTTLCPSQISLCVRQLLCVPRRLWSNRDDTRHGGRMHIDGIRDRILVGSETISMFFQIRGKHGTHIFSESVLVDWRVLTVLYSMRLAAGFSVAKLTLDNEVVRQQCRRNHRWCNDVTTSMRDDKV